MSTLLSVIRDRVRARLNDIDSRRPSLGVVKIDQVIADNFIIISTRLPGTRVETSSAFTIAAAADTATLPASGVQYRGEVRIQLDSNKQFLYKCTREEMNRLRAGYPAAGSGVPSHFEVWEEADQDVKIRVHPRPTVAEVCHLSATLIPADLRSSSLDTVSVEMSRIGETALVLKSAAEIAISLSEQELVKRNLNANVARSWLKDVDEMLYKEEARIHDIEAVGRVQRRQS